MNLYQGIFVREKPYSCVLNVGAELVSLKSDERIETIIANRKMPVKDALPGETRRNKMRFLCLVRGAWTRYATIVS